MANNPAHRRSHHPAKRFGLESMESRMLLSGGAWNHDGAPQFFVSIKTEKSRHDESDFHVSARRHRHGGDEYENFSFQGLNRDRDGAEGGMRRNGPSHSPATPPGFVFLPPWMNTPRPEESPTPPITPASNGNGSTVVEPAPVAPEAPRAKAEIHAATEEPVVTTISDASAPTTTSRVIANASATIASAPQNTTAAVLDWVKSGAIYAADVAGLAPSVAIEKAAPVVSTAVEQVANAEQAVLGAAVNVIAAPAREFHIARLGSPLALMQDAIGSFIEQSVWPVSEQTVASPRRAWYITLTVLTLDAALLTYYFHYRRPKASPFATASVIRRPFMLAINRRND